jgi:hypothetical protein
MNVSVEPNQAVKTKRRFPWRWFLLISSLSAVIATAALWYLVHTIPWMGPLVANTLRSAIGVDNVAKLEDFVYAVEDRINQVVKREKPPKAYWKVPTKAVPVASAEVKKSEGTPSVIPEKPSFQLPDVGPLHDGLSAEGDGIWIPMPDVRNPAAPVVTLKTLIHPDKSRGWAELFVVAIDLTSVTVELVPGYQEPRSEAPEAQSFPRPAKIPHEAYPSLLSAFNGGFMAEHGHYGFVFGGVTFLPPKEESCSVIRYKDGSYDVATWKKVAARNDEMLWVRQGPLCMAEDGELDPSLRGGHNKKFGATLDGNTVIRRSAIGISQDKKVLYVGITNHTTAKALAVGMMHAGSHVVTQMDVNWSYPKFVTYEPDKSGRLVPKALADGFEFNENLYLRERSMRDFFYLTRNPEPATPAAGEKTNLPSGIPDALSTTPTPADSVEQK